MTDQILIALISFAGTLAGSLAGIFTASRLSNYRIEQLEKRLTSIIILLSVYILLSSTRQLMTTKSKQRNTE